MTLSVALLLFWNAALTILLLWLVFRLFHLGKGVKERNVVAVLERELQRRERVEKDLAALKSETAQLQARTQKSLQRTGVVRFNPYNDVGGDQSFAVALLDGEGDGLVFSSLHGREETRVYAKPVQKGEAKEYSLSEEEKEAIKVARR
jgi:hypothetical protein